MAGGGSDLRLGRRLLLGGAVGLAGAVPVSLLALLVRGRWGPLQRLDLRTAEQVQAYVLDRSPLATALQVVAVVLHPWGFRLAVLALVVVLVRRGARRLALWAAVTMALGSFAAFALKLLVARARPTFDDPITRAAGYSFPSGHALNAMVGVLVLLLALVPLLRSPWARAGAWTLGLLAVLLAGADRVGLGVHYVSDVVAGWGIGAVLVAATAVAFETWRREEDRRERRSWAAFGKRLQRLRRRRVGDTSRPAGRPGAPAAGPPPARGPAPPRRPRRSPRAR